MKAIKQKMKSHALFNVQSKRKPPPGPIPLELFIVINETELNHTIPRAPRCPNFFPDLKWPKRDLFNNHEIVIKQADKGGAMVVWGEKPISRKDMGNSRTPYQEQNLDLTTSFNVLITNTLKEIGNMGELDPDVLQMLITEQPRTSEIYLLPQNTQRQNTMTRKAGCFGEWQSNRKYIGLHRPISGPFGTQY